MLPLVDEAVLQSNPLFAALHGNLINKFLNANGSTKFHPAQKERDEMTEALKASHLRASKAYVLKSAIKNLELSSTVSSSATTAKSKSQPKQLPSNFVELIILLSERLTSSKPLSPSATRLLENSSQWMSLSTHLPQIGIHISSHLQSQAVALCRISSPSTNASYLHRLIPKLVPTVQARQADISGKIHELSSRRVELVSKVKVLLSIYHLASTLVILHLEQTVHGSISRELKAKSELLDILAQQLALEAKEKSLGGETEVYTEPVRRALSEYLRALRYEKECLEERKNKAQRILWGYGISRPDSEKERIMRKIAQKYSELQKEIKEVTRDVERLRGS